MLRTMVCGTLIGAGIAAAGSAAGKPPNWHPIEHTDQCVDDNSIKDAGSISSWTQDFCPSDRRHGHPSRITVNCWQPNYEKAGWKVTVLVAGRRTSARWPGNSPIIEWTCFPGTGFM